MTTQAIDPYDLDCTFSPDVKISADITAAINAGQQLKIAALERAIETKDIEKYKRLGKRSAEREVMSAIGHLIWYAQFNRYPIVEIFADGKADFIARYEIAGRVFVMGAVLDSHKLRYTYHS